MINKPQKLSPAQDTGALAGFNDGTTLAQVMGTVRSTMSQEFQDRIPESLLTDIPNFGKALSEYEAGFNEFFPALINQIAKITINYRMFKNPLAGLKRGKLEYGDTIEDIYISPVKALLFNPVVDNENACDVWKYYGSNVDVIYHKKNKEFVYPVSINQHEALKAFRSAGELDRFIAGIMQSIYNGDEIDDFILSMKLLETYGNLDGKNNYYRVQTEAVDTAQGVKSLVKKVRALVKRLGVPSRKYNAKGVVNFSRPEDLYLFITPEVEAELDVEVLAVAFNMSKADFMGHVITVPDFGALENTVALLVDKEWFQMWDTYMNMTTSGQNALHLHTNYFFHHQGVFSLSPFYTAIQFVTTAIAKVSTVTVNGSATVDKEKPYVYTAELTGEVATSSVVWSVEDASTTGTKSIQGVSITQSGTLLVSPMYKGNKIKVIATSTEDETKSGFKEVTVN